MRIMPDHSLEQMQARDARLIGSAVKNRFNQFSVERAEGAVVYDVDGRRCLDFGPGAAHVNAGYSHPRIQQAIAEQSAKTLFAGLANGIHRPGLDLAQRLIDLAPGDFEKRVWFGMAGSDASEAALRLIYLATGKPRVISFAGSMHGGTAAAMGLSGHRALSQAGGDGLVTKVPYPDPYRNPFGANAQLLTDLCLGYLEHTVLQVLSPPDQTSAVWVETLQGESGDIVPPPDFLPRLRALCDRFGLLLVIDDIKMGLGRTGKMFSSEHTGVTADIVLLGKPLGGGLPLSAIVGRSAILDAKSGAALFSHSGHATCCAAGLAMLDVMQADRLAEQAQEKGSYFQRRLVETLSKYEIVGDVRGQGLLRGVDLVHDRASQAPYPLAASQIVRRAWEMGLNFYATGTSANVIEFTPSLIIDRDQIDEGVSILDRAFAAALEDLGRSEG